MNSAAISASVLVWALRYLYANWIGHLVSLRRDWFGLAGSATVFLLGVSLFS
jgi:hypothetical protein